MRITIAATLLVALCLGQLAMAGGEQCNQPSFDLINVSGKIVRHEKETLDKTGEIRMVVTYTLAADDFEIALPDDRHCNGTPKVDFESLIGKEVTLAARGLQKRTDDGRVLTRVQNVVSVFEPLSLRGKLVRRQSEELDKSGEIRTVELYHLETADSHIELPANSQLRQHAGQTVALNAIGIQKTSDQGKHLTYVHRVVSVDDPTTASPSANVNPFAVN